MVAHLISLVFIAAISYLIVPGSSLFSWHPFLMSIGYVGCLFQAILVFSKESSLFGSLKHSQKITLHWIFNTLGLAAIVTAFVAIYYNKEEHGKPHFSSWHAKIGIFTIIYTVIQYFAGHNLTVLSFIPKKLGIGQRQMAMYHATSGTFLYVLACLSLSLGVYKMWFSDEGSSFLVWYLCFAFTALLGLIVANQVTSKYVKWGAGGRGGAASAAKTTTAGSSTDSPRASTNRTSPRFNTPKNK